MYIETYSRSLKSLIVSELKLLICLYEEESQFINIIHYWRIQSCTPLVRFIQNYI